MPVQYDDSVRIRYSVVSGIYEHEASPFFLDYSSYTEVFSSEEFSATREKYLALTLQDVIDKWSVPRFDGDSLPSLIGTKMFPYKMLRVYLEYNRHVDIMLAFESDDDSVNVPSSVDEAYLNIIRELLIG